MQTDARTQILDQVRKSTGTPASPVDIQREWQLIPRAYRQSSGLDAQGLQDLLTQRLRDYDAHVANSTVADLTGSIAQKLRTRGASRVLVPKGLPPTMQPGGFEFIVDSGLSAISMDGVDGVLTQCTLAIAETGTLVLQNVPGQGRRAASLVPDYHLCLVDASCIVATVPEAIARLRSTATLPTTFISGPSATADIEMTRIKGVHGPRFLEVILILAS